MSPKTRSVALLVVGVLLFFVALTADSLGIGGTPGLGYKQLAGAFVGIILAGAGMVGLRAGVGAKPLA